MLKKILAILAFLYAAAAMAAVDVNKGSAAELDGIKGIGPGTTKAIMDERKKGDFKDWADFIKRVKGVGDKRAEHLSEAGLTVNGQPFKKMADAKKDDKKADKKDEKKEAKAEPKKEEKKETAMAKDAKKDEKKDDKKAAEAKPAASAKK